MTAWNGWPKVEALLKLAGRDVSPQITVVRRGMPLSVVKDQIRYWYGGTEDSPFAPGHTLTQTQVGLRLTVGAFFPMSAGMNLDAEAAMDARVESVDEAIQTRLWSDSFLGNPDAATPTNSAAGMEISGSDADVLSIGNAWVRFLEIPVSYWLADYAPIVR